MKCQQLRIIYAGTPEFAVPSLQALIESTHKVVAVYTQPDRPAGRGQKLKQSPIKQLALNHGITVYQPESFKAPSCKDQLATLGADVMVVAAYGLLLPVDVLNIPRLGCVNIHASLLPRWRGAAPIQRAIAAGDTETGITLMQMAKGLDTGDMLYKSTVPIATDTTAQEIHDQLARAGAEGLLATLSELCTGVIHPEKQNDEFSCYAPKINKREAEIDWNQSAFVIHKKICAFNPFPIAFTRLGDKHLRIWRSRIINETKNLANPGKVMRAGDGEIHVACGQGLLGLMKLQLPGKKPLDVEIFLHGRDLLSQDFG